MKTPVQFRLNGKPVTLESEDDHTLLWALRTDLGVTGPKYGCGEGVCGSCTVLVDGKPVRACATPVKRVAGRDVMTIEGLAKEGKLHPLQQAFIDHGALQCGFCTPGMLMGAYALLLTKPRPTREDIINHMDRHLCRCGAHQRIVAAIEAASREMGARP